jgi:hypothetical protein
MTDGERVKPDSQQRYKQNIEPTEKVEKGRRLTLYAVKYCVYQNVGQPIFYFFFQENAYVE